MITILPADEVFLKELDAPTSVEAMVLRDSAGTVEGYALFAVDEDTVELLRVQTDLPMMAEGLVRAVLNAGDCRGAAWGVCRDESLAAMLKRLEFEPQDGVYRVSIEHFFRGECHCEK